MVVALKVDVPPPDVIVDEILRARGVGDNELGESVTVLAPAINAEGVLQQSLDATRSLDLGESTAAHRRMTLEPRLGIQ